jgi:hypothetical protein
VWRGVEQYARGAGAPDQLRRITAEEEMEGASGRIEEEEEEKR